MNLKRILLAFLALAAAVGAYFGARELSLRREVDRIIKSKTYKSDNLGKNMGLLLPSEVLEIKITNPNGSITAEKNEKGEWVVTEPYYYEAAASFIPEMPRKLALLSEDKIVEENPLDLAKYGLDKPDIIVKFRSMDGKWREVHFGKRTPTEEGYFTYNPESKKVFFTDFTLKQDFNGNYNDYLNKKLFRRNLKQADRAIMEIDGKIYEFYYRKETEFWFEEKPRALRIDSSAMDNHLVFLSQIEAQMIVPPEKISPAPDFDKPTAKITFVKTGDWTDTLLIGPETGADFRFVKRTDANFILVVSNTLVDRIENFRNLEYPNAFGYPQMGVKRMEITMDGKTFAFHRENKKSPWSLEGRPEARVDDGALMTFLIKLREVKHKGYVNAVMPEAGPNYGLDNPSIELKFDFVNPSAYKPMTISFGAKDPGGKLIYAYNSKDPNVLTVDVSVVDMIPKSAEKFLLK